nr:hypothetical protein [Sphingomonas sp.]
MAGCSQGPEADLQYIKQALVNEKAAQGKLTDTYAASMHQWLRDELRSSSTSLAKPDSRYGLEIQALLRLPDDAPPEELRARSEKLKQIEDVLESA